MIVIRWPALPCSVVWRQLTAPLAQQLVLLCLIGNLTQPSIPPHPPTHPLICGTHDIFATSEKDSEKPENPNSKCLYYYLLVAIALLCFSCKSYTAAVRHRRVMWH